MKKIMLVCLLFASLYSVAQNKVQENKDSQSKKENDCAFTMASGKMMMIVDGKTVTMDKEMKTKDGAIVMMDGTIKSTNGKSVKMKNGDCMDMSGKMIWVKNEQINTKAH